MTVVRLWQLPQEQVLDTLHYALWPLASLMAGVTAESTRTVAERIVQAPLPEEERRELTGLLVILAGIRLSPTAILDMLRGNPMIDDLLKDNSVAQILIEEGEQRGERRAAEEMAQVALEGRFGPLTEDVLAALHRADDAILRALVAHVTADSLEQVKARLGLA